MPWPIYSERFAVLHGDLKVATYVVPDHMRAVLKSLLLSTTQAGSGVVVKVHGVDALAYNFPAATGTLALECMVVLYQRQTLQITTYGAGCYATASGYVFQDPSDATAPPGGTEYSVAVEPRPLPAELGDEGLGDPARRRRDLVGVLRGRRRLGTSPGGRDRASDSPRGARYGGRHVGALDASLG